MEKEYGELCGTSPYNSIQIHPEQGEYLLEARDSGGVEYDPFSVMDEILYELLCIGYLSRRGKEISDEVQRFCFQYGLLGFEESEIQKRYEDNSVKLYSGSVLNAKALTEQQQEQTFRPFQRELYLQRRRKKRSRKGEQRNDSPGEPILYELNYEHCEAVTWYGRYGQQLLERLERFSRGEPYPLTLGNVRMRYQIENGQAKRRWAFDSLKSACEIGFAEMLLEAVPAIRLCKRCGKPLLTHRTRAAYCSASCRNVENVKQSRCRRRLAETAGEK
ncbi:hypothetical protein EQM14_11505 [Caproiciproducens sp. NJN-50]|uniref:hypothetical protein n=1 Tax=Acutalibacteraceae TaxID=3082771 RepID=UPI000FFE23DC|nr:MULTISPECIES: hypothetical protein [Acutalibacteraceae]QAT50336.1 hypothetical protein EQM14_11505 [Caproiciproducens sp. NJN-50]